MEVKGVRFSYQSAAQGGDKVLDLRLGPTRVGWDYKLNTNVIDTYGGQVVQILSIGITNFAIEGQFGREGPWGRDQDNNHQTDFTGYTNGGLRVGLHQFVNYFRDYFAQATQGGDRGVIGRFNQSVMRVTYNDPNGFHRDWGVYPKSLPSFLRSNDNFAPQWRLECEVYQEDQSNKTQTMAEEISRIQAIVGYKVFNPFSDPLARTVKTPEAAQAQLQSYLEAVATSLRNGYIEYVSFTDDEVDSLLELAASGPDYKRFLVDTNEFFKDTADEVSGAKTKQD